MLGGSANYIRNSVKVTVDAYNGDMTYYIWDDRTTRSSRRGRRRSRTCSRPMTDASADLQAHFRYPENLFQVQASQFATYHVTDPAVFFQKQDVWQIPIDPTVAGERPAGGRRPPVDRRRCVRTTR